MLYVVKYYGEVVLGIDNAHCFTPYTTDYIVLNIYQKKESEMNASGVNNTAALDSQQQQDVN